MSERKFTVNDHFFDIIDTEEKAYMLGFFTADGCNYEDSGVVKIDLCMQDSYMLERFSDILEYSGSVKHYNDIYKAFNTNSKEYACQPTSRLSFRSRQISKQLALKGCVSHKSKYGKFINNGVVPEYLFNHYIRGLLDGDGGISYWEDNPNTHHLKFSINFCSTSDIVQNVADIFKTKFNCTPAISARYEDRDNNNLQFNICGNIIVCSILDWLYKDATIYLNRKYDKYLLLLKERQRRENDKKTLYGNAFPRKMVIRLSDGKIYESVSEAARKNNVYSSFITHKCRNGIDFKYYTGE